MKLKYYDVIRQPYHRNMALGRMGEVKVMCPDCYQLYEIRIMYNMVYDDSEIGYLDSTIKYNGECRCGYYGPLIELDVNIAKTIQILNLKGYHTKFCCEGHLSYDDDEQKEIVAGPYIYFEDSVSKDILTKYPLPNSWVVDDDYVLLIRDKYTDAASTWEYVTAQEIWDSWDKEKSLTDIYKWAKSLPHSMMIHNRRDNL